MLSRAAGSSFKPEPSDPIKPAQLTNPSPAFSTDATASRSPAGDQAAIRLLKPKFDIAGCGGTLGLSGVRMVRVVRLARSKKARLIDEAPLSAKLTCWLSADQAGL